MSSGRKWLAVGATAAVALTAALVTASPAHALTKETTIVDVDQGFVFAAGDLCSFPVAFHQGGQAKIDVFYDANGDLVKEIITNHGGVFQATLSANGKTLTSVQTLSDIITFNPDGSINSISDSGINFVITIPHEGAVYLVVGRIVLDSNFNPVLLAGPGFRTPADATALCNALS